MNVVMLLRKISGRIPWARKILASISFLIGRNAGFICCRRNVQVINRGFCRKCRITAGGNNSQLIVGESAYLENCIFHIEGSNCRVSVGANSTLIGVEFWIEDDFGEIKVGKSVKSFGDIQLASIEGKAIIIGDDGLLAKGIRIRVGDSHSILSLSNYSRLNHSESITIGDHVWIGEKATILKGVTVEKDAVIGAGSIVTHNVPRNSIAVGVPAKIINKGSITWDIQRIN